MAFDATIRGFLSQGTAAARPAAPNEGTTTLSLYFASDTETLSFYDWNDAAWQDISTGTAYTNEDAQDAVGGIVSGMFYNDTTPKLSVIRVLQQQVTDPNGSAVATGDGQAYFRINSLLNGFDLTAVAAHVTTVSSSGDPTIQIRNVTQAADMLSTKLTIDSGEKDSKDAAVPAVIDAGNDDVATGDELAVDIDVAGTGAKGLIVELTFTLP